MKVLVHDGVGVWLAARRLHPGKFAPTNFDGTLRLTREQLHVLVLGLPWQLIGELGIIRVLWGNCWNCRFRRARQQASSCFVATPSALHELDAPQLRQMVQSLLAKVEARDRKLAFKRATLNKITHEMAVLKRMKFASEPFNAEQKSLIEEALSKQLENLAPQNSVEDARQQPRGQPLPVHLPRCGIRDEPRSTTCRCRCGCAVKRIGEDIAEKLEYQPGAFTVERQVCGKWVCAQCETLVQAPVAPHIRPLALIPTSSSPS